MSSAMFSAMFSKDWMLSATILPDSLPNLAETIMSIPFNATADAVKKFS